jgi:subtilisin family serine protease
MRAIGIALLSVAAFLVLPFAALAAPPDSDDPARAVPGEILVGFEPGSTAADRARAADRAGARGRERLTRGDERAERLRLAAGRRNSDAIDALAADPAVAYAEPNWWLRTAAVSNDPYFTSGSLWGMGSGFGSRAATAWGAGHTGSAGVYVGVIDEGIQHTHPDLDGNVGNPNEIAGNGRDDDGNGYVDDRYGWDFANGDGTVYDGGSRGRLDDHGTHVSGTIGGEGGNGTGVAGVNWDVTLISGKFLGRTGGTTANAVRAVDYFTTLKNRGLPVVATNNSWGGGGYSQALYDAIARAGQANILFVAAAGNAGTNNDTSAGYPSNYNLPNVIAVAAIDRTGALASFSQYGATTVDLGAPGVGVWSTTAFNTYSSYNGTSMATPHVTGAAALYKSTHPGATAADVKAAIMSSTAPTASLAGKTVTGGRLDVAAF